MEEEVEREGGDKKGGESGEEWKAWRQKEREGRRHSVESTIVCIGEYCSLMQKDGLLSHSCSGEAYNYVFLSYTDFVHAWAIRPLISISACMLGKSREQPCCAQATPTTPPPGSPMYIRHC